MTLAICRALLVTAIVCLCQGAVEPPKSEGAKPISVHAELAQIFGKHDAAFVMLDVRKNTWMRHNPEHCAKRFSPCSTFKIPNAIIGLDTGAIPEVDHLIEWDGTVNSREAANRDHTLRTAVSQSIVWYFQELARRVGSEQMQQYVDGFDYGNRDLSGGLTQFWLDSSLRIAPDEQVRFLDRLRRGDLPCKDRSMQIVRELIVHASDSTTTVRGKTGSDGQGLGWYVGWVERGDDAYVFAACVSGDRIWGIPVRDMTLKALERLGVLPQVASN
jgi:beta-lactamase class D